jgi:hypothetical protein
MFSCQMEFRYLNPKRIRCVTVGSNLVHKSGETPAAPSKSNDNARHLQFNSVALNL